MEELQKEKYLIKAITDALSYYERMGRLLFIRNNRFSGRITRRNGSQGYVKNTGVGSSDIIIAVNGGITIWLECKGESGYLTAAQKHFQTKMQEFGHLYYVVRSFTEFEKIINKFI